MAVINAGWLTDFKDIKFAPKTLFSQVYVDNPETGSITDLNSYFTTFLQKLDDKDLQVDLTSNSAVKFKNPGAIGVNGTLAIGNGGTGNTTFTNGTLITYNSTKKCLTSVVLTATDTVSGTKKSVIQSNASGVLSALLAHSGNSGETIVLRDSSGNFSAGTITASLSGNADTASKWKNARTITLGGDTSGSVSIDGSKDITLEITVSNNSHTHKWENISDRTTCSINTTGTISGSAVYGAVWNDYAEYRMQKESIKPGYCVVSNNNGQVSKTTKRYQACDGIVSDTFGFAIGETDKCKTPLAVAGRVLAYCEGDRYSYQAGDTVCAGPDGKVCKMTREEIQMWPDRIVGIVSEIPEYETWGTGNVKVNGRIWIKIK